MNDIRNLKFGADPEVFASIDIEGKILAVSPALLEKFCGIKVLEQDDEEKHPIYIDSSEFSWMMDGCAFEVTLKYPIYTAKQMRITMLNALDSLNWFLSKLRIFDIEPKLYKKPVIEISPDMYMDFLDENKIYQGFIFGCDPDNDAIEFDYTCETMDVLTHKYRYGGGHLHMSGLDDFWAFSAPAIKLQAITVGNFCMANSKFPKLEKQRVKNYGKPGRYRTQEYKNGDKGIEYRSPSNSWISFSESQYEELFYWMTRGVEYLLNKRTDILKQYLNPTIDAITTANSKQSKVILKELK
jgi:hypothetical protein